VVGKVFVNAVHVLSYIRRLLIYKLDPAFFAPGKVSWIMFHSGSPPSVRSFQAGHERLRSGAAKASDTIVIGAVSVARSGDSELGRKVLSTSRTKHMRLLSSKSESALRSPPVMLCRSNPEKELTVPVLPPMLE
jgi:hypothetical protein